MSDEGNIRNVILSLDRPAVFHNMIDDWSVVSWSFQDWSSLFGEKSLPFRCGKRQCSPFPFWERHCSTEPMTMKSFISTQENIEAKDPSKWFYFDYKYINEWTPEGTLGTSLHSVSWKRFGFPEIDASGSTIWIGSTGAHTPCHMDTYGCNLVAQVKGKKQWILFPPEELQALKASRVPYEESSIYSQWNFNSPLPQDTIENIKDVYIITLSAGDVLFVPWHWWHYVENLTLSVSINTWIPLEQDNLSRVDEALVRLFVSHVSCSLQSELRRHLLNPNEDDIDSNDALDLLRRSANGLQGKQSDTNFSSTKSVKVPSKRRKICPGASNLEILSVSTTEELKVLLDSKCSCDSAIEHHRKMNGAPSNDTEFPQSSESVSFISKVVNAFCQPDIISNVREQLLN